MSDEEGITKQIFNCIEACKMLFQKDESQISDREIKKLEADVNEYRDFLKSALMNKKLFKDEEYQKILEQFNSLNHFMFQFKILDSKKIKIPRKSRKLKHIERGKSFLEFLNESSNKNENKFDSNPIKTNNMCVFTDKLNKTYNQDNCNNNEQINRQKIQNPNVYQNQISEQRISFTNKNSKEIQIKDSSNSIEQSNTKSKSKVKNSFDPQHLFDSNSFAEKPFEDSDERPQTQSSSKTSLNQMLINQHIQKDDDHLKPSIMKKMQLSPCSEHSSLSQILLKRESPIRESELQQDKDLTVIDKSVTEFIEFGSSVNYFNETMTHKVDDHQFENNGFDVDSNKSNFEECFIELRQNNNNDKDIKNQNITQPDSKKIKKVNTVPKLSEKQSEQVQMINLKKNNPVSEKFQSNVLKMNFDKESNKKISIENFIHNKENNEPSENDFQNNNFFDDDKKDLEDLTSICSKNTFLVSHDDHEENYFVKNLFNSKNKYIPLNSKNFKSKIGNISKFSLNESESLQNYNQHKQSQLLECEEKKTFKKSIQSEQKKPKDIISFLELVKNSVTFKDPVKKQYPTKSFNKPVHSTPSINLQNTNYLKKQFKIEKNSFQIENNYTKIQQKISKNQNNNEIKINFSFTLPILKKPCPSRTLNFFSQENYFYEKSNKENNILKERVPKFQNIKYLNSNISNHSKKIRNHMMSIESNSNNKIAEQIKRSEPKKPIIVKKSSSPKQRVNKRIKFDRESPDKIIIPLNIRNHIKTKSVNKNLNLQHRVSYRVSSVTSSHRNYIPKSRISISRMSSSSNQSNNYFFDQRIKNKFNQNKADNNINNSTISNQIKQFPQNMAKPHSTLSVTSNFKRDSSPDSVFSYGSIRNTSSNTNQCDDKKDFTYGIPVEMNYHPSEKKINPNYYSKNEIRKYKPKPRKKNSFQNPSLLNLYRNEINNINSYRKFSQKKNDSRFDSSNLSSKISNQMNVRSESSDQPRGSEIKKRRIKINESDSYSNNFNQYYAVSRNNSRSPHYKFKENINYLNRMKSNRYQQK